MPDSTVTIGVSAGSEVVCCAVLTTAADGTESFDYRTVTAEGSRTDTGDLVATSIELASEHLVHADDARSTSGPGRTAVARRTESTTRSILSAARRRDLAITSESLVTDTDAALCWLRHTGEVARYRTVLIADVGASGTSISVVDQVDGTVLASERTDEVGGRVFDDRLQDAVAGRLPSVSPTDRVLVAARLRTAKEQLSFHESVTVDLPDGETLTVTRAELLDALAEPLATLRAVVTRVVESAVDRPDAVAVVGGGAFVPSVTEAITSAAQVTNVGTSEPDAAVAKGAALLARAFDHDIAPAMQSTPTSLSSSLRTVGLLAAACAAMAVVLAYGVQALTPSSDTDVTTVATSTVPTDTADTSAERPDTASAAPPELTGGWDDPAPEPERQAVTPWPTTDYTYTAPAVTPTPAYPQRTAVTTPDSVVPEQSTTPQTPTPQPSTSQSTTPTTPSLRPAPDLPIIVLPDFPDLPPWWADLPGVGPAPTAPTEPPVTSAPVPGITTPAPPVTSEPAVPVS
jgi:hypothetical protein